MNTLMSDLDRLLAGDDTKASELETLTLPSDVSAKETKEPEEDDGELIDMVAEVTKKMETEKPVIPAPSSLSDLPKKHGRKGPRGKYACKVCGGMGHNSRTCSQKASS